MLFRKLFLRLCLALEASQGYGDAKAFTRNLLDNPRYPYKRYFDLAMILLVLLSVALLVYSVDNKEAPWMLWLEDFAVTVFVIEYIARLWIVGDMHHTIIEHMRQTEFLHLPFRLRTAMLEVLRVKWAYVISPLAIIDLLAILPSYRPMRLLRVFLLFRLFKLFRYSRSVHGMTGVLSERRFEFYTLAFFMIFVVIAAASSIYVFEGAMPGSTINSFFDALYWAMVTLSTVGYGDITPHTPEGRVVTLALIVSGIGVLAFSTSIVVAAFQDKLSELREHRVISELERGPLFTVICGFGEVGQVVASKLAESRQRFMIIDLQEDRVRLATKRGYLAVRGDAADNELLETIGLRERVHTLVCATSNDVKNVFITVSSRRMHEGLRIIACAGTREMARKLILAGANHVTSPSQIVGQIAAEFIGRPVAFEAINNILRGERDVLLEALRVDSDTPVCGQTVAEIDFPRRKLLLFGIITTREWNVGDVTNLYPLEDEFCFFFKPPPEFHIEPGDVLIIFGYELSLVHFRRELGAGLFRTGLR
ncbi:MAG: potassium channel protein [Gammaproteobacteria bacterium]|nr:potassium channel protein [Gammaproteobacteria bacterium]